MPPGPINNEDDLFRLIDFILKEIEPSATGQTRKIHVPELPLDEIRFDGWPRLNLAIEGEKFDGGLPIRLMPTLVRYQRIMDRAYARSLGKKRARLTEYESKRVELIAYVKPGSTSISSGLSRALTNALVEAVRNMSSTTLVITILGTAAIIGTTIIWKAGIEAELERSRFRHDLEMSELETEERLATISHLAGVYPNVNADLGEMLDARDSLFKSLDDRDQLTVRGEFIADGRTGKRIARQPRHVPVPAVREGEYFILSVDTGRLQSGFRARLRELESGGEITVSIPEGALSSDCQKTPTFARNLRRTATLSARFRPRHRPHRHH